MESIYSSTAKSQCSVKNLMKPRGLKVKIGCWQQLFVRFFDGHNNIAMMFGKRAAIIPRSSIARKLFSHNSALCTLHLSYSFPYHAIREKFNRGMIISEYNSSKVVGEIYALFHNREKLTHIFRNGCLYF